MANDSGYCEPICNFSSVSIKALGNGKIFPVKVRNHSGIFLTSASAQDLRTLDMEKENRDAIEECSPRGVLEDSMRSSEAETSSSKTSTSYSEAPASPCVTSHWRGFLRLWKQKSMRRLYSFPPLGASKSSRKKNGSSNENKDTKSLFDEVGLCCLKPSWKNFGIAELRGATDNFSPENLIGKGGYAEVFKGCLPDGKLVAIKRLTRGTPEERVGDFLLELGIIVHVNHPNAAKFIGYGIEGGMHIVLQLSPHGSLASVLHGGSKEKLNWSIRYKIALGTAEGLRYLHEGCQRRIIHRDIKAANILLTEDFEPQISDFGLAKWLPDQWTHHTVSQFEGTFGYLAPEYFMHGIVDEKTDVFAYGVLLLELITGRKALDSSQQSLVMWAKPLLEENDVRELIDPSLADVYDSQQVNRLLFTASSCVQQSSILRPRMSQVAELLKGDRSFESAKSIQKTLQRTYSEEMLDSADYNSTRYLSDLSRHRELALEF